MFKSVLFVCVGNICRSPVAEGVLKYYSAQYGLGLQVSSCGVYAMVGQHPQPHSIAIAAEQGIDIADYVAKQITLEMVREFELILALDQPVLADVSRRFPFAVGKIKKLGFLENNQDVADPYRKGKEDFIEMYADISRYMHLWMKQMWGVATIA